MAKKMTIGEIFKHERETRGIAIETVAKELRVSRAHIIALEEGRYSFFSARVYARGIVKNYAAFLEFDEAECIREFESSWSDTMPENDRTSPIALAYKRNPTEFITRKNTLGAVAAALILLALFYFANNTFITAGVPHFTFDEPDDYTLLLNPVIIVRGSADERIELTLNEQPIYIESDGTFSRTIVLQKGINTLRLEGRNSFGRTTIIEKRVVVE